jgi:hypothetical protein
MMHLVDTVEVEPDHVQDYLAVVASMAFPVMTDAGASFVSCATTSGEIGERVFVQVVWAFEDHVQWDEIRKNMVLDPRFHEYGTVARGLRVGGTRRFFTLQALTSSP